MPVITNSGKIDFILRVFGKGNIARNHKNVEVWCPVCKHKDQNKRKLAIRVEDDLNHCWICGWHGRTLLSLIKKYGTTEQFTEYVTKFLPALNVSINLGDLVPEKRVELPHDFRLLAPKDFNSPDAKACLNYVLHQRGLTIEDIWYHKLGYSTQFKWKRRILVPSFDSKGSLNYFSGRAVDSFVRLKYDNPECDRTSIIFNELNIDWTKKLVLCEGPFDAFKCGENAVPMLGSDLDERYALFDKIIENNTPVILSLDADMWTTKTQKIAKKLSEYAVDVELLDIREYGKDPGAMSKEEFRVALQNVKKFDWNDSFYEKLNVASGISLSL